MVSLSKTRQIGNVDPHQLPPLQAVAQAANENTEHAGGVCAGAQQPNVDKLLPHHLAELQSSGLTDETIAAAGIYSETNHTRLAETLGWRSVPKRMVPALVFPYSRGAKFSGYARVKPDKPRICDGNPAKYESPKGRPNEVYTPPRTTESLSDTAEMLLITEGEKKALALDQSGYACVGLVGVYGWKVARQERPLPDLERTAWKGREVRIVFDSDVRHNQDVQDAETRLAAHLKQRGAHVRVVRLPDGPAGDGGKPGKMGADDYLVTHGLGAFQKLLAEAEEPAEPDALQMKLPARSLDPCSEIEEFLEFQQQDGISRLRYWRGSWYFYRDGHYAELTIDDVQGMLVRHLNERVTNLSTSVINNHVLQLKAQAGLPGDIEPPAWIGPEHPPWAATEVLACKNQLIHLPSLVAGGQYSHPATPCFFTPVALDYDFDREAGYSDNWMRFLAQLWPDDPQSIALLQEWFGYCLTLDTTQQKILMIVGPKRSGKGTIARVLTQLVGEQNVAGPTLAGLSTNFGLWPLLGKSVAIISDARLGGRTDGSVLTERLLTISGEDALTIDRKQLLPVTCKLDTRLMLLSNELPRFSDASGALPGRVLMLRLSQSWYGREDTRLLGRLEHELPSILLWAIEGWRRLRARGHFVVPDSSTQVLQELNDLSSPVGAFVRQCCEVGPGLRVTRKELFERYKDWCLNENVYRTPAQSTFGRDLLAVVPDLGKGQQHDGTRFHTGIALKEAGAQQVAQQAG